VRENADAEQKLRAAEYNLHKHEERCDELAAVAEHREYDLRKCAELYS
jgi:hypothetical protein